MVATGSKSSAYAKEEMKSLGVPEKSIDDVFVRERRNCVVNNCMDYLDDKESELLIEDDAGNKKLNSMPKIPKHAASDFKHENYTTCAMHNLGLGRTKSMI